MKSIRYPKMVLLDRRSRGEGGIRLPHARTTRKTLLSTHASVSLGQRLMHLCLGTTEEQKLFHRNLAAVTAVLTGTRVSRVANAYGMGVSTLSRMVRRTKEFGQMACVPYATYHRDRIVHPELQQRIRTAVYTTTSPNGDGDLRGCPTQASCRGTEFA